MARKSYQVLLSQLVAAFGAANVYTPSSCTIKVYDGRNWFRVSWYKRGREYIYTVKQLSAPKYCHFKKKEIREYKFAWCHKTDRKMWDVGIKRVRVFFNIKKEGK